jgi:hypothetical protein
MTGTIVPPWWHRCPLLVVAALGAVSVTTVAQLPPAVAQRDANMAELAVEAARRGPAVPVPLLAETSRAMGAVYDQYLLGVVIARARLAAGEDLTPDAIQAHPLWQSRGTVVVAYPINCEGQPNSPIAIRWTSSVPRPTEPSPIREPMRGNAAQAVLPGTGLPEDALVVHLRNVVPVNAAVEIDYRDPVCRGGARTARLPLTMSMGVASVFQAFNGVKLPAEFASLPSPTTVRIGITVDSTGRARFPQLVQGPEELGPAAIALVTGRTFAPPTTNGVAKPQSVLVPLVFTATGEPGQVAPFGPPAARPGTMTVTSTVATPAVPPPAPTTPVPPAPPGQTDTQLARLAIEIAAKGDPVPIPLDAAGPAVHGVLFDRFLMGAVTARAAVVAGKPFDAEAASADLVRHDMIVVAYPLACDGRPIDPIDIQVMSGGAGGRSGPVPDAGPPLAGGALQARLPGVRLPDGAFGRPFASVAFSTSLEVRITYGAPPCGGTGNSRTLPIQWVRGMGAGNLTTLKLPAGVTMSSPALLRLRGLVDLDGAYRFPTVAEGAPDLAVAAVTHASQWKFQPYRANGVAVPQVVITSLTFTDTGAPAPPGTTNTPAASPNSPPIVSSSTIGGRPAGAFTTPDAPNLSVATSRCAIADDEAYGRTVAGAIKVGGGPMEGVQRQRRYLALLRGPSGEGLQVLRRGATPSPDGQTLIDLYEVSYRGLIAPIRLFLDLYHEDPSLKAPRGFTCAAPIVLK